MDQDWTRKAARDAALTKVRDAKALLVEARSIFESIENDYASSNVAEALLYIGDVLEA